MQHTIMVLIHAYHIAGKFGGELKIWWFDGLYYNRQIKIRQNILLTYIRMAIPHQTAKI